MFDSLTSKLGDIFDGLTKRGALSEADVDAALREIRLALLEADVALDVVKDFIEAVRERAVGEEVLRSVTPGQMVIKIVHDHMVEMLGGDGAAGDAPALDETGVNLAGTAPVAIMMVGLQGSGKTTTSAKLALRIQKREKKKVMMASLDVYRPAAQQQLAVLGEQAEVPTLPMVMGEQPLAIAKRAMDSARREGCDVVILDTAGRLHIDQELMDEVAKVSAATNPIETLLVADAMTGQDAVTMAREFNEKVGITGIVLTRVDGDARGGAALSMRAVTGKPIKLMGVGEKLDELESFQATRVAGRIMGQGDIVGLVEKAAETIDKEDAEKLAKKMMKGQFSLNDMASQLDQIRKMGDVGGLMGMIPGMSKMKKQVAEANIDDKTIIRQQAIISSMTAAEREKPKVLNGSRRRRIAAGSGTSVQDVNRLLKQFKQMGTMMKKMGKMGKKGMLGGMGGGMPPGMMPPGMR
ncbi:MAG: signal recognition particle protein [Rhodospirillaceae bacterium]|jgi:signal recognition particle subunit SRP54|nr:signal recognition particle protein [Rhodospirillaceae bacterium]MBT5243736.1 signal recognition particle protein [Rhodospirillaceae bacterium]MBT5563833.1 signal recognition particle protein [Rhodospirillaceae bacterium]MBT6241678.1 signal recognition particle protein [Rhodospirillaceae bacterium]MBT7138168.1 signal recognition particle protein [Rhodospirillaceae bacterium]